MQETTAKVYTRLHHMKSILYKTIKKTSCGTISNYNRTYSSRPDYCENEESELSVTSFTDVSLAIAKQTKMVSMISNDTISTISGDSMDSGVSTLSDFSHYSLSSSTLLLHRTATAVPNSCHLRCDPSVINYVSHNLLTTHHSELDLEEINDQNTDETPYTHVPLAESSRRITHDNDDTDPTIVADEEDEQNGPLTSTLIDRWHSVTKPYSATFREDLTVRKNEIVQILRTTHPHWVWVRNEHSQEGFVPTDCLVAP